MPKYQTENNKTGVWGGMLRAINHREIRFCEFGQNFQKQKMHITYFEQMIFNMIFKVYLLFLQSLSLSYYRFISAGSLLVSSII